MIDKYQCFILLTTELKSCLVWSQISRLRIFITVSTVNDCKEVHSSLKQRETCSDGIFLSLLVYFRILEYKPTLKVQCVTYRSINWQELNMICITIFLLLYNCLKLRIVVFLLP